MLIQLILDIQFLNWLSKNQLTLERPNPKYSQLSLRTKVNININQWELIVESGNLLKARKNVCDQARIGFSFTFDFQFRNSIGNCSKSEINWKHKLHFEAFKVTPLSS